ncbi:MAG TPA: response regulator [Gammaproteobacteria bacterium]
MNHTSTTSLDGTAYAVDDDPLFLDALALTLQNAGLDVRTYRSGKDFLRNYRTDGTTCCLVLDVSLPDLSGLEVQQELAARGDSVPIVFLTGHGDVSTSVAALKNGAFHFLEKPVDDEELLKSVAEALRWHRQRRENELQHAGVLQKFETLTARERQIMSMVVRDNSSKQIARELGISPRTVEHHRAHIMKKMDATSLNELVIMSVICGVRELRL